MRKSYWFVALVIFALGIVSAFASVPKSRSLEFTYDVMVDNIPPGTQEVRIWLPYLMENNYQVIEEVRLEASDTSVRPVLTYDKMFNNKILYYSFKFPQNSSLEVKARYQVERSEYTNKPAFISSRKSNSQGDLQKYLSADRLVTLSPNVQALAAQVTKGKKATIAKASAIYDYVFQNVSYDKTIPGWGNGDTERVCLVKSGNCTDFHSLFISLARASGIPAKFVMGIPLPHDKKEGEIPGYHCWAEFYDEKIGWVPVDVSEAWKDKSKYHYYFGALTEDRLELTHGRDIVLEPPQNAEPLNSFFYPHIEVDGKVFDSVTTTFKFKDRS